MMRVMSKVAPFLVPLAMLGACSKSSVQPISGQIAQATFASPVSKVRASRPGARPVEVAVRGDGGFTLPLTRGRQYQIEFLTSAGQPVLVMPRKGGTMDARFDVRGGGAPFDMGTVRFVGDASRVTVVFWTGQAQTSTPADPDDVECEDGKDPKTGAVCADEPDGDNSQCGDQQEGEETGGTSAPAPTSAAVADQNVPAVVGDCSDEEGDHQSGDESEGDSETETK